MKKYLYAALAATLLATTSIVCTSCNDDDDDNKPSQQTFQQTYGLDICNVADTSGVEPSAISQAYYDAIDTVLTTTDRTFIIKGTDSLDCNRQFMAMMSKAEAALSGKSFSTITTVHGCVAQGDSLYTMFYGEGDNFLGFSGYQNSVCSFDFFNKTGLPTEYYKDWYVREVRLFQGGASTTSTAPTYYGYGLITSGGIDLIGQESPLNAVTDVKIISFPQSTPGIPYKYKVDGRTYQVALNSDGRAEKLNGVYLSLYGGDVFTIVYYTKDPVLGRNGKERALVLTHNYEVYRERYSWWHMSHDFVWVNRSDFNSLINEVESKYGVEMEFVGGGAYPITQWSDMVEINPSKQKKYEFLLFSYKEFEE